MDPSLPQVGDVLEGKYRLVRLIGQGGMGAIYEAAHEAIGKRVAIKVLRPTLVADEEARKRFELEPRAAAATGHRSIIDVYDIGSTAGGGRFLVMELLEGESLGERLDRKGRIKPMLAAYVAAQILSALHAAHGKGIVHRDLKPDNVFLVRSGQALPDVKLLDFGTSIIVEGGAAASRLTQSGGVVGTPYYMAPEQIQALRDLDRRVDIYATGVILYEALTGRVPFVGHNVFSVVNAIMTAPLVPPRSHNEAIPPALESVIVKAMERDRADRYPDAVAMLEALLPFLDDLALARVDLPERLREPGRQPELADSGVTRPARSTGPRDDALGREPTDPSVDLGPTTGPLPNRRGATRALLGGAVLVAALALLAWLFLGPPSAERPGEARPPGDREAGGSGPAAPPAVVPVEGPDAQAGLIAVTASEIEGDAGADATPDGGSASPGRGEARHGGPRGPTKAGSRPLPREPSPAEPRGPDAGPGRPAAPTKTPSKSPPVVPFERTFE